MFNIIEHESTTNSSEAYMQYNTSELCDLFADSVDVLEPLLISYGGRSSYGGEIVTIKCFEHKGLIEDLVSQPGQGKVLLIDGGGSLRRGIVDARIAQCALDNEWEGIICYGSVRDVDMLAELDIGIHAVSSTPASAEDVNDGEVDIAVNFAGVTFIPQDHVYADNTGIILSQDPLDID